jgi:muramoyltetrapeptide carboxypeptidase LdcA involved in peptidoglycan recycling
VPDYNLMLENIDAAAANIKRGIESLHPMKKLTQLESYVLGHLRSAEAVLDKARDAVQKTRAIKEKPVPTRLEEDQD